MNTTHAIISIYRHLQDMTHLSKQPMDVKTSLRIKKNLLNALKVHKGRIIEELLTPTEFVMLAKRLALIIMLTRKYSSYQICKTLNVSISTVLRFDHMLESGVFKCIQRELASKKAVSFLEFMEVFLSRGPYGAEREKRRRMADIKRRLWA